ESPVDVGRLQVRSLAGVAQEVDPADDAHDAATPAVRLSSGYGQGPFAGQRVHESPTEYPVLIVQMLLSERIRECRDGIVGTVARRFMVWLVGHARFSLQGQHKLSEGANIAEGKVTYPVRPLVT